MIIVIEGADGTGKSGLTNALFRKLFAQKRGGSIAAFHFGPPPYEPTSARSRRVQAADDLRKIFTAAYTDHVIVDRWSWGCPVYGPVFRPHLDEEGYGELGKDEFFLLEDDLATAGGITIWLDAPADVIKGRLDTRGDAYLSDDIDRRMDQISQVRARYARLAPECKTYAGTFQLLEPNDTEVLANRIVEGEFTA